MTVSNDATIMSNLSVGTTIRNATGTNSAPTYTFTGDLTTGMFRPTASNVAWSTNGVERMRLDAIGELGIGTTNPQFLLDVCGTARISSNLTVGGTTNITGATTISNTASTTGNVGIRKAADADYALDIKAESTGIGAGIRVAHATNTNLEGLRIQNPSGEFTVNIANATNAFQQGAAVGDVVLRSEKSKLMLSSALSNIGIQPGIAIQGASVGIGANPDMARRLTVSGTTKFANGTVDYITQNDSKFTQYYANGDGGGLNANHFALWSYPASGGTIPVYTVAPSGRMTINDAYFEAIYVAPSGAQLRFQMMLGFLLDWSGADSPMWYTDSYKAVLKFANYANTVWLAPRTITNLKDNGTGEVFSYWNDSYYDWIYHDIPGDRIDEFNLITR